MTFEKQFKQLLKEKKINVHDIDLKPYVKEAILNSWKTYWEINTKQLTPKAHEQRIQYLYEMLKKYKDDPFELFILYFDARTVKPISSFDIWEMINRDYDNIKAPMSSAMDPKGIILDKLDRIIEYPASILTNKDMEELNEQMIDWFEENVL